MGAYWVVSVLFGCVLGLRPAIIWAYAPVILFYIY
jgi:hypothetical protein